MYLISNECSTEVSGTPVSFNFTYDATSAKYGYLDASGTFVPFESGGTDVSDTTATAATVRNGYYFYNAQGVRTRGTYQGILTNDATAYAKNIEGGYTAYCRGSKITGIATVIHGFVDKNITQLSYPRQLPAATNIGNYALIGGGYYRDSSEWEKGKAVDAYDNSLTRTTPSMLSEPRIYLPATNNPNYALFGGGGGGPYGYTMKNNIDAYNSSLSRTAPGGFNYNVALQRSTAASVGNYAILAGGENGDDSYYSSVFIYDSSLTRSTSYLNNDAASACGCHIGSYALFVGGYGSSWQIPSKITYFNNSLTRSTIAFSIAYIRSKSATIENRYALIGGSAYTGISNQNHDTILAIDTSLSLSYPTTFGKVLREQPAAAALIDDNVVLFAGGLAYENYQQYPVDTIYAFDYTLTKSTPGVLGTARTSLVGTNIGGTAIFAGGGQGTTGSYDSYVVDACYIS